MLEWFRVNENVHLQYPQLPCLTFGKDGRNKVPMELCFFVEGSKTASVLTAEERSAVIKKTSEKPAERKRMCDIRTAHPTSRCVLNRDMHRRVRRHFC